MKTKTYLEDNKTIIFNLTDNDNVIIEIYDYSNGVEQYSVNLNYYDFDFSYVIDMYKSDTIKL